MEESWKAEGSNQTHTTGEQEENDACWRSDRSVAGPPCRGSSYTHTHTRVHEISNLHTDAEIGLLISLRQGSLRDSGGGGGGLDGGGGGSLCGEPVCLRIVAANGKTIGDLNSQ